MTIHRRVIPILFPAVLIAAVLLFCACHPEDDSENQTPIDEEFADDDDSADDDDDDDDDDDSTVLRTTFFDVGLGDATLVEATGGTMLVDGGSVGEGTYKICPFLEAQGIDSLDVMVMTHPHYDHAGGLSEIFDCVEVDEVWVNGEILDDEGYNVFSNALEAWDGTVVVPGQGDQFTLGENALITVLNTGGEYEGEDVEPINNDSLVLLVEGANTGVLLTADAEYDEQEDLFADWGTSMLQADVVKIPNHGGAPYSQNLIDATGALYAVLSVGENTLGLPSSEAIAAWEAVSTVYATDVDGTVRFTWNGEAYAVETGL